MNAGTAAARPRLAPLAGTVLLTLVAILLNFLLGVWVWLRSLAVFDDVVTHYSPAMPLPTWQALPFMAPAYVLLGAAAALWSRRGWLAAAPVLIAFFFALGGARAAEFAGESLWDDVGRPGASEIAIGLLCATSTLGGWHATRALWRRFAKRGRHVVAARAR